MEMNKIFRDSKNNMYTRISTGDIAGFDGNFISVVNGKAVCRLNGSMVSVSDVLYNEIGVDYHFVSYKEHGLKMAKKHGVYKAVKQESIRV